MGPASLPAFSVTRRTQVLFGFGLRAGRDVGAT
jgi:hypothetical protein